MNQNISKNLPPLVSQSRFNQPPPPKFNNSFEIPPKVDYFNKPVRQSVSNSQKKLDYVDYVLYITYGFMIMFVLALIMAGISYFKLNSLEKNNKDNKDKIEKWNKIFTVSMILLFIPLLILLFMICANSPMSCVGLFMLRR